MKFCIPLKGEELIFLPFDPVQAAVFIDKVTKMLFLASIETF